MLFAYLGSHSRLIIDDYLHVVNGPTVARYASEWDARHQRIIDLREGGARTVAVRPLSLDLAAYMRLREIHEHAHSAHFYKLDAILLEEA